ncbi:hypothetical protein KIPB_014442, partial [Kipferlia bialata]|eukprot:g14442.t1
MEAVSTGRPHVVSLRRAPSPEAPQELPELEVQRLDYRVTYATSHSSTYVPDNILMDEPENPKS